MKRKPRIEFPFSKDDFPGKDPMQDEAWKQFRISRGQRVVQMTKGEWEDAKRRGILGAMQNFGASGPPAGGHPPQPTALVTLVTPPAVPVPIRSFGAAVAPNQPAPPADGSSGAGIPVDQVVFGNKGHQVVKDSPIIHPKVVRMEETSSRVISTSMLALVVEDWRRSDTASTRMDARTFRTFRPWNHFPL